MDKSEWDDLRPSARELQTDAYDHKRFRVEPSKSRPKRVFINCHYCGYTPPLDKRPFICPKCGGSSWERFAVAEKLLPPAMLFKNNRPQE